MHHGVQTLPDRVESSQAQQIQRCGPHRGQHASPVTAVAVFVLVELGIANPLRAFNAPALPDLSQQGFWGGAQVGEEQMPGPERLALTAGAGQHLHDPGTTRPIRLDVLRCLFGSHPPR